MMVIEVTTQRDTVINRDMVKSFRICSKVNAVRNDPNVHVFYSNQVSRTFFKQYFNFYVDNGHLLPFVKKI